MSLLTSTENEKRSILNWDEGDLLPMPVGSLNKITQRQRLLWMPTIGGGLSGTFKLKKDATIKALSGNRSITVKTLSGSRSITIKTLSGNKSITSKLLFESETT